MERTGVITTLVCAALVCATPMAGLSAGQKTGSNPILKEPLRVKQGQLSGVPGRNQVIAVFKGIPFGAPPVAGGHPRPRRAGRVCATRTRFRQAASSRSPRNGSHGPTSS
jgi:hypothetical protein